MVAAEEYLFLFFFYSFLPAVLIGFFLVFLAFTSRKEPKVCMYIRAAFAVVLTPMMLAYFVWLEEIAKGVERHYWGIAHTFLLNRFFVEFMFAAFIPLAFGTFFLLVARNHRTPKKVRGVVYIVTVLALASTLFVGHSLITVPRAQGLDRTFRVLAEDFVGNLTRGRDGEYTGAASQTVFIQNYTIHGVSAYYDGYLSVQVHASEPVNLTGELFVVNSLFRRMDDPTTDPPLSQAFAYKPLNLSGESGQWKSYYSSKVQWGGEDANERFMTLDGYQIVFSIWVNLRGADHGDVLPFTGSLASPYWGITREFLIFDFPVASHLQNGVAVILCGCFAGIYLSMLVLPSVRTARTFIAKKDKPIVA